jgi:hypothetical protein
VKSVKSVVLFYAVTPDSFLAAWHRFHDPISAGVGHPQFFFCVFRVFRGSFFDPPFTGPAPYGRALLAVSVGKSAGTFCVTAPVAAHSTPRRSVTAKPTHLIASIPCPIAV